MKRDHSTTCLNLPFNRLATALLCAAATLTGCTSDPSADQRHGDDRPTANTRPTNEQESRFFGTPRQVTFDGRNGEGYFAADGSAIIFQSIRGDFPFYQIYTRRCDPPFSPDPHAPDVMVSTGHGRTTCAYFHPSGKKIIYASSHLDPNRDEEVKKERARLEELRTNPHARRSYSWDFDPHMDIFEADPDGSNLRRLTDAPGYDAEGAYSPDGSKIVFCSLRDGTGGDIYVMNSDGSNVKRLTEHAGYAGGPFFSPDGKRIIYRAEVQGKPELLQIFVMDADGGNQRQLTDNDAVNFGPYWHPDSKHIIFATSLHGHRNYELYLMNVDTGSMERVTFVEGADVLPVFSPDGSKLMWTSTARNHQGVAESQLFIADWVWEDGREGFRSDYGIIGWSGELYLKRSLITNH